MPQSSHEKKKERPWLENPLTAAGAVGLPAVIAFLLARRIRNTGPVSARIAKAIREKGLLRHIPEGEEIEGPLARLGNYLQYGTKDVIGTLPKKMTTDKVLLSPFSEVPKNIRSTSGTIGAGGRAYRGSAGLEDKLIEAKRFAHAGNIYPKTISGADIPSSIWKIRNLEKREEALRAFLNRRLGKRWIAKDPFGADTGGIMLDEEVNLAEHMRRAGHGRARQARGGKGGTSGFRQGAERGVPAEPTPNPPWRYT
jgi:hypothetical protein